MKLICNNIWGGRVRKPFFEFLKNHSKDADVFCFQEIFHHGKKIPDYDYGEASMEIFSEISEVLPGFKAFLAPRDCNEETLAIFVKEDIVIEKVDYIFVQKGDDSRTMGIPLQYIQINKNGKQYTICNFHGWWSPSKGDSPERLLQSENIKKFLDTISGSKIICGDFNLMPDTQSMGILEKDMKNLIKEYGVTSTRSHFYTKKGRFADYILTSKGVSVEEFGVLEEDISDHFPLMIKFS